MSNTFYVIPKDSDLTHYGVLGMKWGVRRYQNVDGSLTTAGQRRYLSKETKNARRMRTLGRGLAGSLIGGGAGALIGIASAHADDQKKINQRHLENDMISIQSARLRDAKRPGRNDFFPNINEQSQTAANLYKAVKGPDVTGQEINLALRKSFREAEKRNDTKTMLAIAGTIGMGILTAAGAIKNAKDYQETGDLQTLLGNNAQGMKQIKGAEYIGEISKETVGKIKDSLSSTIQNIQKTQQAKTGQDIYNEIVEKYKDISEDDMDIDLRTWKLDNGNK